MLGDGEGAEIEILHLSEMPRDASMLAQVRKVRLNDGPRSRSQKGVSGSFHPLSLSAPILMFSLGGRS